MYIITSTLTTHFSNTILPSTALQSTRTLYHNRSSLRLIFACFCRKLCVFSLFSLRVSVLCVCVVNVSFRVHRRKIPTYIYTPNTTLNKSFKSTRLTDFSTCKRSNVALVFYLMTEQKIFL